MSKHTPESWKWKLNEVAVGQVAAALMGKVSPEALAVGIALAGFVPFDFHRLTAWPTWDTLKKLTVIGGRDRINRALKELEDGGHIRKRPRSRGESCIWILTCLADHYPDAARETAAERDRLKVLNAEMLEALKNLENDNGKTMPKTAWALVQRAIAKAEEA